MTKTCLPSGMRSVAMSVRRSGSKSAGTTAPSNVVCTLERRVRLRSSPHQCGKPSSSVVVMRHVPPAEAKAGVVGDLRALAQADGVVAVPGHDDLRAGVLEQPLEQQSDAEVHVCFALAGRAGLVACGFGGAGATVLAAVTGVDDDREVLEEFLRRIARDIDRRERGPVLALIDQAHRLIERHWLRLSELPRRPKRLLRSAADED